MNTLINTYAPNKLGVCVGGGGGFVLIFVAQRLYHAYVLK